MGQWTNTNKLIVTPVFAFLLNAKTVHTDRWRGLFIGKTLIPQGVARPASALIIIVMISKREYLRNWRENVVKGYL